MKCVFSILLVAVVMAAGQELARFVLEDGSGVVGTVLTGDPNSIVIQTDTGRLTLARRSIARMEAQTTPVRFVTPAAGGADLRELGRATGRRAADDAPGGLDMAATCCATSACWPLAAPIASALARRTRSVRVPARLVAGATGEYADGLRDGYVQRMTERRHDEVCYGIVGGGVVFTALALFLKYEAAHVFDGFEFDLGLGDL